MINRSQEIHQLNKLTEKDIIKKAGNHLVVKNNLDELYKAFAKDIEMEIRADYKDSDTTRLILPVGPTEQYDLLITTIKKEKINLANCWFFFMDEYCDKEGKALPENHPLSFKRIALTKFINPLKGNGLNLEQIVFPNENNIEKISDLIKDLGGIDTCYGGIGIHGHLAFNEPASGISESNSRKVKLNKYTITINSIRSSVGGDLENFPKYAYTLGMKQILQSQKIRLCCRSDVLDWGSTILRIALFGEPGDDYPVTHIRNHPDYVIFTDKNTLESPKNIL